jgi:hypothetical protein
MRVRLALLGLSLMPAAAADTRPCAGNYSVATFQLNAQPPAGGPERSVRRLNAIPTGHKLIYRPGALPAGMRKEARLALVLAPPATAADPTPPLSVIGLKPVDAPAQWTAPFPVGMIVLVLGPQGLDEKRIMNLITKDEEIFAALADYAAQTEDIENTIEDFNEFLAQEQDLPPARTPSEQALLALLRAVSPGVAAYSPLGAGRRAAPIGTLGKISDGFFQNAGGIVPGGGILPEMKSWLFPDTEFRAVFVEQQRDAPMALCAQRASGRTRNRIAYIWARRVPDLAAPRAALAGEAHLPIGVRSTVALPAGDHALLDRVDGWTLRPVDGAAARPVPVRLAADARGLEIDLRRFDGPPGNYRLQGRWDWADLNVEGALALHRPGDLSEVDITRESAARLAENSGVATLILTGADFQFIEKVTLKRAADRIPGPVEIPFFLPQGRRRGPQTRLEIDIDTTLLRAGQYALTLYQAGGVSREMPVQVQPAPPEPPRIDHLPLRLNTGEQTVAVTGVGLDRIESIESSGATVRLGAVRPGGREREMTVSIPAGATRGQRIGITARIAGDSRTLDLAEAIEVLGPRPRLTRLETSLADDLGVALLAGELPAGSVASFLVRLEGAEGVPRATAGCAGETGIAAVIAKTGADTWLLSVDPGSAGRPGCELHAIVETHASGSSDPAALGRVVRLPRIDEFTLTDERLPDGSYAGQLRGEGLETIERAGWDAASGLAVIGLPRPVAAQGPKQVLRIAMPWPAPSPRARLFIWMRGETAGRATRLRN